jgi:hypothetical protein
VKGSSCGQGTIPEFLEGLRKTTINFSQDSQPPHQELKPKSKQCAVFLFVTSVMISNSTAVNISWTYNNQHKLVIFIFTTLNKTCSSF